MGKLTRRASLGIVRGKPFSEKEILECRRTI